MPSPKKYFKSCCGCPNRTITCKFDGSCDEYEKELAKYKAAGKAEEQIKKENRLYADYEASNVKRARMHKGKKMGSNI